MLAMHYSWFLQIYDHIWDKIPRDTARIIKSFLQFYEIQVGWNK